MELEKFSKIQFLPLSIVIVDFTDQDVGPQLLHLMTYYLGKGEGNTVECESFLRAYLINGGARRQRVSAVTGTVILAARR